MIIEAAKILPLSQMIYIKYNLSYMGPPQFKTSVQHKRATPFQPSKSLSSSNPSFQHTPQVNTKKCVVQMRFWDWTEGISVLNWGVFGVELRHFWWRKVVVHMLNWFVETRGSVWNWGMYSIEKFYLRPRISIIFE